MQRLSARSGSAARSFVGPALGSGRGYSSRSCLSTLEKAQLLARRVLTGQRPRFPIVEWQQLAREAGGHQDLGVRQHTEYVAFCRKVEKAAEELAIELAKDGAKELIVLIVGAFIALIVAFFASDDDLKKVKEEALKEKAEIEKEIKDSKDEESIKKAALAELEKQYISWSDWWNDTTGKEKVKYKATLAEIAEAQKLLSERLAEKETVLKNVAAVQEARAKRREQLILDVD